MTVTRCQLKPSYSVTGLAAPAIGAGIAALTTGSVAATAALATTTAGTAVVAGAFGGEARWLGEFSSLLVYVVISSASRTKQVTLCGRMSVLNLEEKERQAVEGRRIWLQGGVVDLKVVHVHTKE